jgi:hypothetical protein
LTDRTPELQAKLQSLRGQLLGPWEQLSAALFERMAQQIGYREAKRIFTQTTKQYRPRPGAKRPPPRKTKGRRHNPMRDMLLLTGWLTYKEKAGNNKAQFARMQLEITRTLPRWYGVGSSTGQIVRRLNRLLAAGITSEQLMEEQLKRDLAK